MDQLVTKLYKSLLFLNNLTTTLKRLTSLIAFLFVYSFVPASGFNYFSKLVPQRVLDMSRNEIYILNFFFIVVGLRHVNLNFDNIF